MHGGDSVSDPDIKSGMSWNSNDVSYTSRKPGCRAAGASTIAVGQNASTFEAISGMLMAAIALLMGPKGGAIPAAETLQWNYTL